MNLVNPLVQNDLETIEGMKQENRFKITDLGSLSWAMRMLSALAAKKNDVNNLADEEVTRIEDYRKSELNSIEQSESFFKSLINEYAVVRRESDPKFTSEKTPYGKVGFRKQQAKWIYKDKELLKYLDLEHSELIRIKHEPIKTEIKKRFKVSKGKVYDENGQVVDGIVVEERPDIVEIKVEV
ncbi:host-nuclease inhibitor Gam family protein [Chengkuizengella sp. SCS-71B]|uniref:host-nuclease inhibitor Gam family protein n=1 Tax=Chengkuizengella sp. SCS-71B TaxID=3115290 RepID=UPI0032C233A0